MTPNDLELPLAKKATWNVRVESSEYQSRHGKGHIAQGITKQHFFQFKGAHGANV